MKKIIHFLENKKKQIEGLDITPVSFFITLFSISLIRTLIENFSNPEPLGVFTDWTTFLGYILFYSTILFMVPVVLSFFINKKPTTLLKYSITLFPIILVAPIVDLLITQGAGLCMAYNASHHTTLLKDFVTFFGPIRSCGITIGIRFEILLILCGVAYFIYSETKNTLKTIGAVIASYAIIFLNLSLPGLMVTLDPRTSLDVSTSVYFGSIFNNSLLYGVHTFIQASTNGVQLFYEHLALFISRILWVASLVSVFLIFFISFPSKIKAFLKNSRPERLLYYLLIAAVGSHIAYLLGFTPKVFSAADIFGFIVFGLVLILNFLLAVQINDIEDISIDTISNTTRPLVTQTLSGKEMVYIAWILGFFVLTGALLFNYTVFVLMVLFQVLYVIYSVPPLRLRTGFPINPICIGTIATVVLFSGYFLVSGNQNFISFPKNIALIFFLFITTIASVKDLKDTVGDKKNLITTLPTLLGETKAFVVLCVCVIAWFLFIAIKTFPYFPNFTYALYFLTAIVISGLIFKKKDELSAFVVLYLFFVSIIIFVR